MQHRIGSIRIRDLRSLVDTGWVPLLPITMLIGANSSGKSTLLRFFPLLRQSVETRTTGPVLWFGNLVDFGGFDDAVRRQDDAVEPRSIEFGFRIERGDSPVPIDPIRRHRSRRMPDAPIELFVTMTADSQRRTRTRKLTAHIASDTIVALFNQFRRIERLSINGADIDHELLDKLPTASSSFLPRLRTIIRRRSPLRTRDSLIDRLTDCLSALFHGNVQAERIDHIAERLGYIPYQSLPDSLRKSADRARLAYYGERLTARTRRQAHELLTLLNLPDLLANVDAEIRHFAGLVSYVKPFRASPRRYTRSRELAVDEIDPVGENLPDFLASLSHRERDAFADWCGECLGASFRTRRQGGHIHIEVETEDEYGVNLTDMGYGYSQVLPVLAQLWVSSGGRRRSIRHRRRVSLVAIEQPELHLHPRLQSLLATGIVGLAREPGATPMFLETHSEAIVNQVGSAVAVGRLDPDHAQVLSFSLQGDAYTTSVQRLQFNRDGTIEDWPVGFFAP